MSSTNRRQANSNIVKTQELPESTETLDNSSDVEIIEENIVEVIAKVDDEAVTKIDDEEISSVLNQIKNGIKTKDSDSIMTNSKKEHLTISPDEEISVRSCIGGGLNWVSKISGIHYKWNDIDDVQDIKYSDLEYMFRMANHHLTTPNVIVEDERVIKSFKLLPKYMDVAEVNDLKNAIKSENAMFNACEKAKRVKMRDLLIDKLTSLIDEKILTDYNVIRVAEDNLNCELIKKK